LRHGSSPGSIVAIQTALRCEAPACSGKSSPCSSSFRWRSRS
jgi:hypothetical protein